MPSLSLPRFSRAEIVFSTKSFAAAMLAMYLASRAGLPRPFWALMTTYVVAHPLAGAVRSKAVYRFCGTLIGSTATVLQFSAEASELQGIKDLGKPENVNLVKALGLEKELERADMVAAAKRTVDGVLFYEYDLALSPLQCDREMATACLPVKVILLSMCVRDGKLHLVRVDADPVQWKRAGTALRLLRSSFAVAGV